MRRRHCKNCKFYYFDFDWHTVYLLCKKDQNELDPTNCSWYERKWWKFWVA